MIDVLPHVIAGYVILPILDITIGDQAIQYI